MDLNHHSTEVRMRLLLNGHSLRIAQMGPNFLIMRESIGHPPAKAEITLTIDGVEDRWPVFLPEGLDPEQVRTPVARPQ